MAKLVTIYGGSGFVGRYVARMMAQDGWRVRIAVRRPDEALFTRTYGAVGQVVPVLCNIRDAASVKLAMQDADAVINCVNLTGKEGKSTFETVLVEGAANIARISAELGVQNIVHISGIGVDAESPSKYVSAKARGEAAVLEHRPDAVILRPSVIFGTEDQLFNRFAGMSRFGPLMMIAGGNSRMQPVFVEDVAAAATKGLDGTAAAGVYELGGPDILTLRELVQMTLKAVDRRRAVINLPFWLAGIGAGVLDLVQTISGGLIGNKMITRDQLHLLRTDNVVSEGAKGFADLGIEPTAPEAVIDSYLWRFRPSGQYDAIKASAKNLRHN
ncbi:complex I NDUFA9 subunit family protein [Paracoccus zhejiangensis]|uniref:Complex I NDUFA9 subunit family protein n=1 Tax=Paracoccus zhejiangensis TaxID=1077935 RepID=A0A2H5F2F7_9RHOB|nr:complex I NDUFA9 subunit family protein [Paracoccus zhejiangensis]AUH65734.1 complex I NDUFA9 subunit family protein [Paracoccus zhejiangensis]